MVWSLPLTDFVACFAEAQRLTHLAAQYSAGVLELLIQAKADLEASNEVRTQCIEVSRATC